MFFKPLILAAALLSGNGALIVPPYRVKLELKHPEIKCDPIYFEDRGMPLRYYKMEPKCSASFLAQLSIYRDEFPSDGVVFVSTQDGRVYVNGFTPLAVGQEKKVEFYNGFSAILTAQEKTVEETGVISLYFARQDGLGYKKNQSY